MALKFGLAIMNDFPPEVTPASRVAMLREQTRAARDAGLASIWALQHYLGNMPTLQPVPLLAALAADSGEMTLGTNMFILPLRHPVDVAEDFATLDHLSGGRAIAGFGMGYRDNEFDSFGISMDDRIARYEESVGLVRDLWTGKPVHHNGEHFRIDGEKISLPPVQENGIPVWIGAGPHKAGARRAARLGDAWIVPPHVTPEKLRVVLGHYQAERELLGKGPSELVVRRELVLDEDPEIARAVGLEARGEVTRKYAEFNAPDQLGNYKHLASDAAAAEVADQSYLFTDPTGAVKALKALEAQGLTYIVLRMQWYGLSQERVLRTLEMFKEDVLPEFAS